MITRRESSAEAPQEPLGLFSVISSLWVEMKSRSRHDSPALSDFAAMQAGIRGRKLKILIVDDIPSVGNRIAEWLAEEFGAEVKAVDSGFAAIDDVSHNAYNCIFLDLMMPKMSGVTTFHKISDHVKRNSIVMMSADRDCPEWAEAKQLGFDPIEKPFTEEPEIIAEILNGC